MSSASPADLLSFLAQQYPAFQEQIEAQEKQLEEVKAAYAKQRQQAEQLLTAQRHLLGTAQKSLEKLTYLELRADSAGGEPSDISRHVSQWLAEYDPKLSRGDESILELGVLSHHAAFQRSLEQAQTSATLPQRRAWQLALSLISESLTLQQQNDILSAQKCRKAAEFNLQQSQQTSERLKNLAGVMTSQGYTSESFQAQQAWLVEQQHKEVSNISYYTDAEQKATAQLEQTQRTLKEPSIAVRLMTRVEIDQVSKQCEGLFAVWVEYWKTEATKQGNLQSRLKVEVELSEPEEITMDNLADLQEKVSKKARMSEGSQA